MGKYDDIIDLPHYEPRHKRMPLANRAAQFAPFAALTGHDEAISETSRLTEAMIELSAEEQSRLSRKLTFAFEHKAEVIVTHFRPDGHKAGGAYVQTTGLIKNIDMLERKILLSNGGILQIEHVVDIKGSIFDNFEA